MSTSGQELCAILTDLTGQTPPLASVAADQAAELLEVGRLGLGHSQLNELLLLLGYDRITHSFYQYLVDGSIDYRPDSTITSFAQFRTGVDRFRKIALLLFGNVKFGFKTLSSDADLLRRLLSKLDPIDEEDYLVRHEPIKQLEAIPREDTFYLGYIVQQELVQRLKEHPDDAEALAAEAKREETVTRGVRNHEAYLASDHLDVYIATSMRERHEYLQVNRFARDIFSHPELQRLKVRWFDPTQAYCHDRIDKGLSEALMLKRAKCTLYFVQEADTLGKDSELACTLAQGKPVIAFVPVVDEAYVNGLIDDLRLVYPQKTENGLLLDQLRVFEPRAAWEDPAIRGWLDHLDDVDTAVARKRLNEAIQRHYDRRASFLRESHPLGIQVHLDTGVANGVLVARTIDACVELVRRILTRSLEFALEERETCGRKYLLLKETVSESVFRVMTGDQLLTNTFWNVYLNPVE